MKKFFFIAVAAVIALAACTKNNADTTAYEQSKVINFSAVAGKATKAPITTATFSHEITTPFGVFAYYLEHATPAKTWAANGTTATAYMSDVPVSYSAAEGNIWAPSSNYYWPLQGSLTFFAYWPNTLSASYTVGTKTLSLGSFTVDTTVNDQIDVLVSSFTEDQTANTTTYSDGAVTSTKLGVPINFKHVLSQVVFTAKAANDVYTSGLSFKINSLTVGARKTSTGMTVIPGGTPSWNEPSTLQAFSVLSSSDTPVPNATEDTAASSYLSNTTWSNEIGSALLMIPVDNFDGDNNADDTDLAEGNDDEYIEVTYTLYRMNPTLNMGQKTVRLYLNANDDTATSWAPGRKYIYQLTIGLEKILFAPVVTEWVTETNPAVEQPVTVPQPAA